MTLPKVRFEGDRMVSLVVKMYSMFYKVQTTDIIRSNMLRKTDYGVAPS